MNARKPYDIQFSGAEIPLEGATVSPGDTFAELETRFIAARVQPPILYVLRDYVEAIANATGKKIRVRVHGAGGRQHLYFDNIGTPGQTSSVYYTCSVADGDYVVKGQSCGEQWDLRTRQTEKLAWRICGFLYTPAEIREAAERARRDGTEGAVPLHYFYGPGGEAEKW
jgi:hypothetical protein